ncbi:MAG: DUF1127 domain-containing protein [Bauldia sp.]
MVTTEFTHGPAQRTFAEGLLAAVARFANRVVGTWHAAQNRRAVAKLLFWDDRMLHDIGLTQGDVYSVMAAPAGEDPSRKLTLISTERRAAIRAEALQRLSHGTEYDPPRRKRRRLELVSFES